MASSRSAGTRLGDLTNVVGRMTREQRYEHALKNCFMLARRMLYRKKGVDPEWTHIMRLCREADEEGIICETSVLRKEWTR
jgi:hypothetical protein